MQKQIPHIEYKINKRKLMYLFKSARVHYIKGFDTVGTLAHVILS